MRRLYAATDGKLAYVSVQSRYCRAGSEPEARRSSSGGHRDAGSNAGTARRSPWLAPPCWPSWRCFLQLFRRGARPGTMLLVWAVLDPLTRLGLEQLRVGAPERQAALTETLLVWLAADAVMLGALAWRRRQAAGSAFARAIPPSHRALGFGARAWVSRSTATSPKVGR
jgi:hypothetical protein